VFDVHRIVDLAGNVNTRIDLFLPASWHAPCNARFKEAQAGVRRGRAPGVRPRFKGAEGPSRAMRGRAPRAGASGPEALRGP